MLAFKYILKPQWANIHTKLDAKLKENKKLLCYVNAYNSLFGLKRHFKNNVTGRFNSVARFYRFQTLI